MRRVKRLGALLIVFVMVFTMIPFTTAGAADTSGTIVLQMGSTNFTVNGTSTKIDEQGSKPVQTNGYTMLPLRAILEATGGTLAFDAATNRITITRGGDTVVLTLNTNSATVNGETRTLGAAPYAQNSRTYVHIRTLELFGMKVDWDEKSGDITVTYVDPSKIFNLKLQNGMGTAYTSVQIAPMPSLAGEPEWSGNLLGSDTLYANGNLTVQAPLTGTGHYQLRCQYASATGTLYHTISNIDLTSIRESATILMNSATAPTVTLDGTTATTRSIQLYIVNNTGRTLNALYCKKSTDTYYDQNNNLLQNQVLVSGGQTTVSFQFDSASPYYNFYARESTGLFLDEYKNVQLATTGSTTSQAFATLTLSLNGATGGTIGTSGSNTTTTGNTAVRFTNNTDSTIYELRASTTNRSTSIRNGEVIWSDTSGLRPGRSTDFNMDIGSTTKWYFGAITSKNSTTLTYAGLVDFKKTTCTSIRVTLTDEEAYTLQDWEDCTACGTSKYDYDDDYKAQKELFDSAESLHSKLDDKITEDEYDDLSSSRKRHYVASSGSSTFTTSDYKYDGSSSGSSSSSGDVDLVLLNSLSDKITSVYAINVDDFESSMTKYDLADIEDDNDFIDLLDGDSLKSNQVVIIKDALEANEDYYLAIFTTTKSSSTPISSMKNFKVELSRSADYAVMNVRGTSSCDSFDSTDDNFLMWVDNEASSSYKVEFKPGGSTSTSRGYATLSVSKDSVGTKVIDTSSYTDWEIDNSDYDKDIDLDDFDYGIVWITISSSGKISVQDID